MSDATVSGKAAVDLAFTAYNQGIKEGERRQARPAIRSASFPFENGDVVMSYPDAMSQADVEALESYFALITRQMRRRADEAASHAEQLSSSTGGEKEHDQNPPQTTAASGSGG